MTKRLSETPASRLARSIKKYLAGAAASFLALSAASAQVDAITRDLGLREFLGVHSIGASVPVTSDYVSGFVTALVYKDGQFASRLGDQPLVFSYGSQPISVGNAKLGAAPASVHAELLWGTRNGESGYLLRADCYGGGSSLTPFHVVPDLPKINRIASDLYRPGHPLMFEGFYALGAAAELESQPKSDSLPDLIAASKVAVILVFQQFKTPDEAKAFQAQVAAKFPAN